MINIFTLILMLLFPLAAMSGQVVVLPEKFQNKKVVTVNSPEYNELLKKDQIVKQLEKEKTDWELYSKEVDRKVAENWKVQNEMVLEIQKLKEDKLKIEKQLVAKDFAIWTRNAAIAGLITLIGVLIYLRIKGIL